MYKRIFIIISLLLFSASISPQNIHALTQPKITPISVRVDKINPFIEIASPFNNSVVDAIRTDIDVNYSAGKLVATRDNAHSSLNNTKYFGNIRSILLYMNDTLIDKTQVERENAKEGSYTFGVDLSQFKDGDEVSFQAFTYGIDMIRLLDKFKKNNYSKQIAQQFLKIYPSSAQSREITVHIIKGVGLVKQPNSKFIVKTEDGARFPVNQFILNLKEGFSRTDAENIANSVNGRIVGEIPEIALYQIEVMVDSVGELDDVMQSLFQNSIIESVSKNYQISSIDVDSDLAHLAVTQPNNIRAYDKIKIREAWEYIGSLNSHQNLNDIVVGVVDTGADRNHPEFEGVDLGTLKGVLRDYDEDPDGHGTGVVGIIGANNWIEGHSYREPEMNGVLSGVTGITGKYRFEVWPGLNHGMSLINAISNSIKKGSKVVNLSLTLRKCSTLPIEKKLFYSCASDNDFESWSGIFTELFSKHQNNILFVIGAGNEGVDSSNNTPANILLYNTIVVASSDLNDNRSKWFIGGLSESNYGNISIAAPGSDVYIPKSGGGYKLGNGTSFAAPMVSGVAAMLFALDPNVANENKLTPRKVKNIIVTTGDNITTDKPISGKRLNAEKAVCAVINCQTTSKLISDHFDGNSLNNETWQSYTNNGTINVADSFVSLSANNPLNTFPYVHTKLNPFPEIGDFSAKIVMQYLTADTNGAGLEFDRGIPVNGHPNYDNVGVDPLLVIWQDKGPNAVQNKLRAYLNDQIVWSSNGFDFNKHTIVLKYINGKASISIDGGPYSAEVETSRPTSIWFGNASKAGIDNWSSLKIDQIKVSQPSEEESVFHDSLHSEMLVLDLYEINQIGNTQIIPSTDGLHLKLAGNNTGSEFHAGINSKLTVKGDFEAYFDFKLVNWPDHSGARLGMVSAILGGVERVSFTEKDHNGQENYLIHFIGKEPSGFTPTTDTTGKLKFKRVVNTLT